MKCIYQGGGLIFSLLGAGIALGLFMTPDNGKNRGTRLSMLMAFAFLTGLGLGPLLSMAIMVNPSLVPSAFMLTSAIFACFTGAALFAPDGKYLYLGGTLLSGLSTLLFLGFLNIFFRSQLLFQVNAVTKFPISKSGLPLYLFSGYLKYLHWTLLQAHLYIGLAIFCGFIMFDTQVIIRKARNGDKDFIAHSLDLFIDFVQIFRKVLILLMQKVRRV